MAEFRLKVNGQEAAVDVPPATSLLRALRDELGLRGTKESCGRGECGACTVLVDDVAVLSCVLLVEEACGEISTIEQISDLNRDLREAFADCGAFQCGFCTPGQITRAAALLQEQWPTESEAVEPFVRRAMSGNVCRCTGYTGIVDAIIATAKSRGKIPGHNR
jgi:aerobic-type carbon monoxide dehydrogenase small subunit (CoxS/CutS family)